MSKNKKPEETKSVIDHSKLKSHPKQKVTKNTNNTENTSNTENTNNTENTSNINNTENTNKDGKVRKRMGPAPATPQHFVKSSVKMNPDTISKIKFLILKDKEKYPNREQKHGMSYTGISNARPETKALINPPTDMKKLPFDVNGFIKYYEKYPYDPSGGVNKN